MIMISYAAMGVNAIIFLNPELKGAF